MKTSRKLAAVTVAVAVMASGGVAQATHTTGKAGAPGQVCKPLKLTKDERAAQRAELKAVSGEARKALRRQFRAERKARQEAFRNCVRAAAKARSEHEPTPSAGRSQGSAHSRSPVGS